MVDILNVTFLLLINRPARQFGNKLTEVFQIWIKRGQFISEFDQMTVNYYISNHNKARVNFKQYNSYLLFSPGHYGYIVTGYYVLNSIV